MYPDVFFRIFPSYIYFLPPLIFFSPQYTLFTSFDIFSLFSQLKFFFLARFLFPQQQAQLHRCPLFPIRSSIYAYPRVFHLFPLPSTPRLVISSYLATMPFLHFQLLLLATTLPPFHFLNFCLRFPRSPLSLSLSSLSSSLSLLSPSPSQRETDQRETVLPFFFLPREKRITTLSPFNLPVTLPVHSDV